MTTARNTFTNANIAPRVFLSYARDDGEAFATQLRQRLEAEHIPLWQDRVGLEVGHARFDLLRLCVLHTA